MRSLTVGRDERGAAAIVVSLSLVAVMAAGMLSIDAGMLWSQRRTILTGTDAAALDEARRVALVAAPPATCDPSWTTLVTRNGGPEAEPLSCSIVRSAGGRTSVEVQARLRSQVGFGHAVGVGDQKAFSSSMARIDPAVVMMEKLRPMGVCTENAHLTEWLSYLNGTMSASAYNAQRGVLPLHPAYPDTGVVHRVMYTKDQPTACGEAPGNWGLVDFNGGSTGTPELRTWILNGYTGHRIAVDDCNADNATAGEWCPASTGAFSGSIESALTSIIGVTFPLPLFDRVVGTGSGATYHLIGFLGVKLHGFQVSGTEAGRYLDLEFVTLTAKNQCCVKPGVPAIDAGIRAVRLCSADHDPISESTRCR